MTTRDEIMTMDEDALRLAVAKARGLTGVYIDPLTIAAAYALEDALPEEKCALYVYNLLLVYTSSNNENNIGLGLIHASAADRCRAWLWTMDAKP